MDLNLPNGHDLRLYGRLLLDGDLNIKAHEDQKTKHRYAFIFEKLMILVKPSNTKVSRTLHFNSTNSITLTLCCIGWPICIPRRSQFI